ncbi:translation initiation factor IF-2 [Candidatus Peregrinibacteria bacterium]|nr:MAG: translation initiation factor IF-2 [Candidatus Peregrinibacteria bacterium]
MEKTIRAAAVAKHIGITSQDLRKMLSEVNFGVKPNDREFPESLASGIVRFAARRLNREIPPLPVHYDEEDDEEEEEEREDDEEEEQEDLLEPKKETAFDRLNRLAKTPSQREEKKIDQEVKPPSEEVAVPAKEQSAKVTPAIFRKIEVSPEEAAAAKKRHEEEVQKSKEDREQEALEKKAMERRKKRGHVLVKKEGEVEIPATISIKEFSEKVGVPAGEIISVLLKNGVMVTMTQTLDFDTYAIIAPEIDVQIRRAEETGSAEALKGRNLLELLADEKENLVPRPPVIVVMGHVDHGKTKILDAIRQTKVAEGEAGGITQHIGAYQIEKKGHLLTFLDTPGHEAFTAMRARGAKTADIAILVVAADEGVKPQTIEAIHHAQEAGLPIIVAVNKIDKPDANIEKVKGELAVHSLTSEDWGGDTVFVPVSALQNQGISDLLDMVILRSEFLELTANPKRLAIGTIIESNLDHSLGPVATILVNTGTLSVGNDFILGEEGGRIKTMLNDEGKKVQFALPGMPVRISGLSEVPSTGEILQVLPNAKAVREKREELRSLHDEEKAAGASLTEIMAGLQQGSIKFLKLVLKTDTEGSLEAVRQAIEKIESKEVRPKIIHAAVGGVTETDIMMAAASQGIVFGFHVAVSPRVRRIAEKEKVEVQNYEIIYQLVDDIRQILSGLLEPEVVEEVLGQIDVKQIFYTKKKMMIVGCRIRKGYAENGALVRIFRGENQEEPVGQGKIASLQHFEKKVQKIEENQDCGIQFEGKISIEEGDRLEVYKLEERMRTL